MKTLSRSLFLFVLLAFSSCNTDDESTPNAVQNSVEDIQSTAKQKSRKGHLVEYSCSYNQSHRIQACSLSPVKNSGKCTSNKVSNGQYGKHSWTHIVKRYDQYLCYLNN
jgi:hypothetical protein